MEFNTVFNVILITVGIFILKPNSIKNIIHQAIAMSIPVQSTYLMEQPENPSLKDSISMFSIKVKNLVD